MTLIKTISTFAIITSLASTSLPSAAHDFWLEPHNFVAKTGQEIDLFVKIGHPHDKMMWSVDPHRVISLRSLGPNGITDHQAALASIKPSKAVPINFSAPGIYMVSIETTQAFSELSAQKFSDYVDEEGLTPIKLDRLRKKTTDKAGTEVYSRRGKTLIQIGEPADLNPDYITQPIGMTLEIVPKSNPARLAKNEMMRSQVFYRGKPVTGVTIGLIDLNSEDGIIATDISDTNGMVTFQKPKTGSWMLHAVWSDPLEDTRRADYDTVFSSLSFQVP